MVNFYRNVESHEGKRFHSETEKKKLIIERDNNPPLLLSIRVAQRERERESAFLDDLGESAVSPFDPTPCHPRFLTIIARVPSRKSLRTNPEIFSSDNVACHSRLFCPEFEIAYCNGGQAAAIRGLKTTWKLISCGVYECARRWSAHTKMGVAGKPLAEFHAYGVIQRVAGVNGREMLIDLYDLANELEPTTLCGCGQLFFLFE